LKTQENAEAYHLGNFKSKVARHANQVATIQIIACLMSSGESCMNHSAEINPVIRIYAFFRPGEPRDGFRPERRKKSRKSEDHR
jgi:hypothetical protein